MEWAECRGLSLRVKRDERVGGLVVGWGGCECDGLVSNTLSLSVPATSTHLSMASQSSVLQSHCAVATSISVLVLLCFLTFSPFVQSLSHWSLALGMVRL